MIRAIILLAILLVISGCAYTVIPNMTGNVVDSETGKPIAGATIETFGIEGRKAVAKTGPDGNFSSPGVVAYGGYIRLVPTIHVSVQASGYQSQDLSGPYAYSQSPMKIKLVSDLSLVSTPPQAMSPQTRALLSEIESQMVAIPAGSFQMGTGFVESRRVNVRTFLMAAHDVTYDEYDTYVESTGRTRPEDNGWGRGKHPVVNVSWEDAQAFIVWLNQQSGKHFRLPSEAEWEYAARAGTTTRYYWGGQFDSSRVNNNKMSTAPVGSFPPNDWGLYDMSGNVYQWTQDCWNAVDFWTGRFKGAPSDGSAWTKGECIFRVTRGGYWGDDPLGLSVSSRTFNVNSTRANYLGFRIAQDL